RRRLLRGQRRPFRARRRSTRGRSDPPMTVLQLVTQREPAGAQRVAHRLDQGFRERGIEGDVAFLYRKADAFEDEGYQDLAPKRPGPLGLVVLAVRLFRLLRSTR